MATDKKLSALEQCALVSLVASSQIVFSRTLEQIFSCQKTLLFYEAEDVKWRIWANVLLRHFLQEFGPTPEIGLAVEERIDFNYDTFFELFVFSCEKSSCSNSEIHVLNAGHLHEGRLQEQGQTALQGVHRRP